MVEQPRAVRNELAMVNDEADDHGDDRDGDDAPDATPPMPRRRCCILDRADGRHAQSDDRGIEKVAEGQTAAGAGAMSGRSTAAAFAPRGRPIVLALILSW